MTEQETHAADSAASRLFDLRTVIAVLFAIYGVVVLVMGFTSTSDEDIRRAGDINLNLWSGVGMLLVAAAFAAWAFLRPLRLPTPEEVAESPDPRPPAH